MNVYVRKRFRLLNFSPFPLQLHFNLKSFYVTVRGQKRDSGNPPQD